MLLGVGRARSKNHSSDMWLRRSTLTFRSSSVANGDKPSCSGLEGVWRGQKKLCANVAVSEVVMKGKNKHWRPKVIFKEEGF